MSKARIIESAAERKPARLIAGAWRVLPFLLAAMSHRALAAGFDEVTSWEHAPSSYQAPEGLVRGGAFIDRILPMPDSTNGLRSDVWGGPNVKPRNVENGIEDPNFHYWCRSVFQDASDGRFHLFGARWPERHPKGFDGWPASRVYHAVADEPTGPFRVVEPDIGHGHNVTCYRAKDGSYVIGVIYDGYRGPSVNGPWTNFKIPFDFRGSHCPDDSNNTYTPREDGSVVMINQPGRVWISEDGLKPFRRVTDSHGGHPYTLGIFEDPILWRDEVQYNVIFNDWYGRTAYYLRSKDGVNWVWDQGLAYDVNVARHRDGSRERWFKFERPSVLQDAYGRATHIYFAVLDTRKDLDKPNDGHTSKNIALPLVVPRRLAILDPGPVIGGRSFRVKIKAEPGFAPRTGVKVDSLKFGAPSAVDFGRGLAAAGAEPDGDDLVVTFAGEAAEFTSEDFVGKLIGRTTGGDLLLGYARLPGVSFNEPILNANRPEIRDNKALFVVENFGMTSSVPGTVTVSLKNAQGATIAAAETPLPAIPAYGHASVDVPTDLSALRPGGTVTAEYCIKGGGMPFMHRESFQRLEDTAGAEVNLTQPATGEAPPAGPFVLSDRTFTNGIAVRSPSANTWLLDGSFEKLSFQVGAPAGSLGASTVEVWGDGKRLYASSLLRPKSIYQETHAVSVPVKGVHRLSLISNAFFVNDRRDKSAAHVFFAEPKLTRTAATTSSPATAATRTDGKAGGTSSVPRDELKVVRCDSEETDAEDGRAANLLDGNPATIWHTQWKNAQPPGPHELVLALATPRPIAGIELRPRNGGSNSPDEFDVHLSADNKTWSKVLSGRLSSGQSERFLFNQPSTAGWLKLVVRSARDRKPFIALSELAVLTPASTAYQLDLSRGEHRAAEAWLKAGGTSPDGTALGVNSLYWTRNGRPWTPVMGEFHFYRYPAESWKLELRKMKAAGVSIVSSYIFWEVAEATPGTWNWTGDNDLRRFVQLAQKAGLYVWLRPGPYVNGEILHQGIPAWSRKHTVRADDPQYLAEVRSYFGQVAAQVRGLWFKDGGPVIGCQLENEYAHGSKDHIVSLKTIAEEAGFAAPFYSVTANSEYRYERGDVLPLQGAYPYRYWETPKPTGDFLYAADEWGAMENLGHLYYAFDKFPRGMCELGGGCLNSYAWRFVVPAHDMEGSVQNVLGRGVNLVGYYMFHGGTHKPGLQDRSGIPLNFDYQSPLGEFGQRRPSYHALKLLHFFLNDFGDLLGPMQPVRPANQTLDARDISRARYAGRFNGNRGFLFMTTCQANMETHAIPNVQVEVKLGGETLKVPAEPITLPRNTSPVMPVNLDLNGTALRYATAQLLCRIEAGGTPCFVFFAHDGIGADFQFDGDARIETTAATRKSDGHINVFPAPSRSPALSVTAPDGRKATVLVLSRADAERAWRMTYRGRERLLLSDADLIAVENGLELASSNPAMKLLVFPAMTETVSGSAPTSDGAFSAYTFTTARADIALAGTALPAHTWTTAVPKLPANVRDLVVQVNYTGSTADLLADKALYTDHRHIGLPFEFSLRRFLNAGTRELTVAIHPWDPKVNGIPASFAPTSPEEQKGMIRSIVPVPEYAIRID